MAKKGIALHIGLNQVDPAHYAGWDGSLSACELDAKDMQAIAKTSGFDTQLLLTQEATAQAVSAAITAAAKTLNSGDLLLITYSGHGGQVPDTNHDEPDGQDETWVLYDRQLLDDELFALWAQFKPGVRIAVFSDSCHSGSVVKAAPIYEALGAGPVFRYMPVNIQKKTYAKNQALYDQIQDAHKKGEEIPVKASVILISGCQDNQFSMDGPRNGLFTGTLRKVWNQGQFKSGYRTFRLRIAEKMPPTQSPNFFRAGVVNPAFERQKPFTI